MQLFQRAAKTLKAILLFGRGNFALRVPVGGTLLHDVSPAEAVTMATELQTTEEQPERTALKKQAC